MGITRAEKKLFMTRAYSRLLYGKTQHYRESRFMQEIDDQLLQKKEKRLATLIIQVVSTQKSQVITEVLLLQRVGDSLIVTAILMHKRMGDIYKRNLTLLQAFSV